MQTELFGEQLKFSAIFSAQPCTMASGRQATDTFTSTVLDDIKEAKDSIKELKEELIKEREDLVLYEIEDYDREPEPGEECIFEVGLPSAEEEYNNLKFENDTEIHLLELKIAELEAKMKHAN